MFNSELFFAFSRKKRPEKAKPFQAEKLFSEGYVADFVFVNAVNGIKLRILAAAVNHENNAVLNRNIHWLYAL